MTDYKKYLAASIVTEDKTVTYRLLSRAMKVHVNTAKEMLYDFHRQQNAKKPGTLHATYIISGTKRDEVSESNVTNGGVRKDGEDEHMQSSPFMPSSAPQVEDTAGAASILAITLAREEDLERIKSQYTTILSIHIYSLSPAPLKDLQVLSDVTRQLRNLDSEDPLQVNSVYGIITNPSVRRRTNRRPPPPPAATVTKPKAQASAVSAKPAELPKLARQDSASSKSSQPSSATNFFGKAKEKSKLALNAGTKEGNASSKESTPTPAPPPSLKRQSSSIFKAFAKTKEPVKREKDEDEDVAMSDDGDDDGEEPFATSVVDEKDIEQQRKSRKERADALRKMMDDESDDEQDSKVATPAETTKQQDVEMQGEEEDVKPAQAIKQEADAEPEPTVTSSDGRRRGKRKVMKKKTVEDEEGYLVTREEAVWESFSEDEPVVKAKPKPQPTATGSLKSKKPAGKPGQGSIMSFFGKK